MSWKSYYSVQPCQSKILQARWDEHSYNRHVQKLAQIQPQIDTRAPKTYIHMHLKLNKIRMEEERLYIIERDNRVLLEKMSHTMRTKGRIDNVNKYTLKSLNKLNRQQELLKITKENRSLMERILRRKPEYDRTEWEKDWKKNVECMENLTNYPKEFRNDFKKFTQPKPQKKKKKIRSGTSFTQSTRYNNNLDNNETQMGVDYSHDHEENTSESTEKKVNDPDNNTDSNRTGSDGDATQKPPPQSFIESETKKTSENGNKEQKDESQDYESDFDEEEAAVKSSEKNSPEKLIDNNEEILEEKVKEDTSPNENETEQQINDKQKADEQQINDKQKADEQRINDKQKADEQRINDKQKADEQPDHDIEHKTSPNDEVADDKQEQSKNSPAIKETSSPVKSSSKPIEDDVEEIKIQD